MKPKIFVSREIFPETLDYLARYCNVSDNQADIALDAAALAHRLEDRDGLLCFSADRISRELIQACPKLTAIANAAVGYNNIDVAAATAHNILVTNTPGVLDDSTADLTWALILASARRTGELEAFVRAGKWGRFKFIRHLGLDVHHATLGIIGMGRIGQAVARRARGFDMQVLYQNRSRLAPDIEAACNARYVEKEELLRSADFITLHLPYESDSHHLIGARELAMMKPTAILINAARGGIVDELALIQALKSHRIAAAGIDVFDNEPQVRPEFFDLSNVVLLPHVGSATEVTRRKMASLAAQNLVAALTTGNPPNLVNPG
jgi:glyoxylate/hydroxypyruvate/2-ketogluconate reductase